MKKFLLILLFLFLYSSCIYAEKPKYIFLFIGDGMSMSSETALSLFLYGRDKMLFWNKFPIQTYMTTWSIDSYQGEYNKSNFDKNKGYNTEIAGTVPYPYYESEQAEKYFKTSVPAESASAATAMSTGQKVYNQTVCYDKKKKEKIKNIVDKLNEKKEYNVALITTDHFYSATPAAFSSHNVNRKKCKEIAAEILSKTKPEIIVGKNEFAEMNTFAALNDYYILDSSEINESQVFDLINKKIFLRLNKYYVPVPKETFTLENFEYRDINNKFSNIVLYTIKILLQKERPFFALIEVSDIDKANHKNNYNKMLGAMYELNDAVKSIYDLINSKYTDMTFDNTLIIVTADHSTGMLRFREYIGKQELPFTYVITKNNLTVNVNKTIDYKTHGHTNELVGCYCIGSKSNLFYKYINEQNIIDNTDIYNVLNDVIFSTE